MSIKLTLPNGVVLEGEASKLRKTLRALGYEEIDDGLHYLSSSRGLIAIKDMPTPHIMNAICKRYHEWTKELSKVKDKHQFISRMHTGPNDRTMMGLIAELARRP